MKKERKPKEEESPRGVGLQWIKRLPTNIGSVKVQPGR